MSARGVVEGEDTDPIKVGDYFTNVIGIANNPVGSIPIGALWVVPEADMSCYFPKSVPLTLVVDRRCVLMLNEPTIHKFFTRATKDDVRLLARNILSR